MCSSCEESFIRNVHVNCCFQTASKHYLTNPNFPTSVIILIVFLCLQIITNQEFTKAFAKALMRPAFFPLPELVVNLLFGEERAKVMTQGQQVEPKRVLEYNFQYKYPKIETACKEVSKLFYNTPF